MIEWGWTAVSIVGLVAALSFVLDAVLNRAAVKAELASTHGERRRLLRDAKSLAEWQMAAGSLISLNFVISVVLGVLALTDSPLISELFVWSLFTENIALTAAMIVLWVMRIRIAYRL